MLVIGRLATILVLFGLILSLCQPVYALERPKASVSVLFINNAKTTYDDELTKKITDFLSQKVDGIYLVKSGQPFLQELNQRGIHDLVQVEKLDIAELFRQDPVDYVICADLQPFIRKEKITVFTYGKDMTATFYLKIVDIPNNKYLYNGKFIIKASDSTTDWLIGNKSVAHMAIDKILIEIGEVISFRLPLNPPAK